VRKDGNRLRITPQLINATNGFHLWSDVYECELKDIFAVQDEIAQSLASVLKLTLLSGKILPGYTKNSDAYNDYLLGQYYLERRTKADMEKAISYYDRALAHDPDFATAWVALARARVRQADWGLVQVDEGYRTAREAIERALMIDPDLALAHSILGQIKMAFDWDWTDADSSLQNSISLDPNNPDILANAAALFAVLGRMEQSVTMFRQVAELDPLNLTAHYNHAVYSYYAGYFDESEMAIQKALALNSEAAGFHLVCSLIHLAQSNLIEAFKEIEQETDPGWQSYGLSLVQYALGNQEEADSALTQFIADYENSGAFQIAGVYAYRGEFDSAFQWLERAYNQRDSGLPSVKFDPIIRKLSKDQRYFDFLLKMNLPI
jgi:tetratricopeptide (TPR) repeat protein